MFVCKQFCFTAICLSAIFCCAIPVRSQYVLWRLVDPYKTAQNARFLHEVGQDLEFALDMSRNSATGVTSNTGSELVLASSDQLTTSDLAATRDPDQLGASSLRREPIDFPLSQEAVEGGSEAALEASSLTSFDRDNRRQNPPSGCSSHKTKGCPGRPAKLGGDSVISGELDSGELGPLTNKHDQAKRLKISKNVERILSQFMKKPKTAVN